MFDKINDLKEIRRLIEETQASMKSNREDLFKLEDQVERTRIEGVIIGQEHRLKELEKRETELIPNPDLVDQTIKYQKLREVKNKLENDKKNIEEEIRRLEDSHQSEESKDEEYLKELDKHNEEIKSLESRIGIFDSHINELNNDIQSYPHEEITKAASYIYSYSKEIFYSEIENEIKELEEKYNELRSQGEESEEEIKKHSELLAAAYSKQIMRYNHLINFNPITSPQDKEYLRKQLESTNAKFERVKTLDDINIPEEEKLSEEEIARIEEETLQAQERINELEEKLKTAIRNKEYYDQESLNCSNEILKKTTELIEMIKNDEKEDARDRKQLSIDHNKVDLNYLVMNQKKFQTIIDDLTEEINKNKEIIKNNQELLEGKQDASDDTSSDSGQEEPEEKEEIVSDNTNPDIPEQEEPEAKEEMDPPSIVPAVIALPEPKENEKEAEAPETEPETELEPEIESELEAENQNPVPAAKIEVQEKEGRVLNLIVHDILTDKDTNKAIDVSDIQRKRFERSKIAVTKSFTNEVKYGSALYNVVGLGAAIIRSPIAVPLMLIQKGIGKLLTTKRTEAKLEKIRENIRALPDEDKKVLFEQYFNKDSLAIRARGADGIIREEAIKYKREKEIAPKVIEASSIYSDIFESYNTYMSLSSHIIRLENGLTTLDELKQIPGVEVLVSGKNKEEVIAAMKEAQKAVMQGKAEKIRRFQELNEELKGSYGGGGIHGLEEEEKAKNSRMNERAKRFGLDISTGEVYDDLLFIGKIDQNVRDAIKEGKDKEAVEVFVKGEQYKLSKDKQGMTFVRILKGNPLFPKGIPIFPAGKGNVGTLSFIPLAKELDYRPDPFIRNLVTTAAGIATIASMVGSIQHNIEIRTKNAHNKDIEEQVHRTGQELESKQGVMEAGLKHQNAEDNVSHRAIDEYSDSTWNNHGNYAIEDEKHHLELWDSYKQTQKDFQDIQDKVTRGQISSQDALEQMSQITNKTHIEYVQLLQEKLPSIENWARSHPEFNYDVLIPSIKEMIANPNAMEEVNKALFESIQKGGELQQLVIEEIPQSIIAPIIGMGGSALMIGLLSQESLKGFTGSKDSLEDIVKESIENDRRVKESVPTKDEPQVEMKPEEEERLKAAAEMTSEEKDEAKKRSGVTV